MRGRIPLPTAVKKARGGRIKAKNELTAPTGRPKPKNFLSPDGRKHFKTICSELESMQCLSETDGLPIAVLADLWATYADLKQQIGETPTDPGLRRLAAGTANQILQFSREFGLTPSARTRLRQIDLKPPKSEDDLVWDELAEETEEAVLTQ